MGMRDDASTLTSMIFGYDIFVVNETIITFSRTFFLNCFKGPSIL